MTAYWPRDLPAEAHGPGSEAPGTTGTSFSIVIGRCGGTVVVTLEGALDTLAAPLLANSLEDLIDAQGNLAVAVNLRGLDHVAPSGLRVLSGAASNLERRGGSLSLREPTGAVLRALDVAGLTRLIGHTPVTSILRRSREPSLVLGASTGARARHPAGTGRRWDPHGGAR
jgi:anti-anti-sigma factor